MSDFVGALRVRIALQSPARTEDDIGGAAIGWADEGGAWASVDALSATQRALNDAAVSMVSFRVVLRRRDDVRPGWRVLWGGRVLRVAGVRDGGGRIMDLLCEEETL